MIQKRTAQEEAEVKSIDSLDDDAQRMSRAVPQQGRTSIIGGSGWLDKPAVTAMNCTR